jgi:uncharacterized membrane protein
MVGIDVSGKVAGMSFGDLVEYIGDGMELAGIAVIVIGTAASFVRLAASRLPGRSGEGAYERTRRAVGRSILLGLELLVAGDIIRTVAVSPSFTSVGVLAGVVLIRTFLSFTLELEITGRWPWQKPHGAMQATSPDTREA